MPLGFGPLRKESAYAFLLIPASQYEPVYSVRKINLIGKTSRAVYIWDIKPEKSPQHLQLPVSYGGINGCGFSQDSKHFFLLFEKVVSFGEHCSMVIVWDVERKRWVRSLGNQPDIADACAFCADGK